MNFYNNIESAIDAYDSNVCVGIDVLKLDNALDSDYCVADAIIDATKQKVAAYKLNLAHYQANGTRGVQLINYVVERIRIHSPHSIIIADGKHGDVPHTANIYAKAMFQTFGFDACTVNPYIGIDSVEEFLSSAHRDNLFGEQLLKKLNAMHKPKGIFAIGYTSNHGSNDFQELPLENGILMYQHVVNKLMEINDGNIGIVAGTSNETLYRLKWLVDRHPNIKVLVPGIGIQGGNLHASASMLGKNGLYSASRSLISYKSKHFPDTIKDIRDNIRHEVQKMNSIINNEVKND